LLLLPEGKHGKYSARAKKRTSERELFIPIHPILIPDFYRAGEAMFQS